MRAALAAVLIALAPAASLAQGDSPPDNVVDQRIATSAIAAESLQGPLDGGWTLVSAAGQPIYAFQLVDRPGGSGALEGVWRDLRVAVVPGDIGFIDSLIRDPAAGLSIAFVARPGDPPVTIALKLGPDGAWAGELHDGATVTEVKLRRN